MNSQTGNRDTKNGVMLFADIMNSALLAYFLNPLEYDDILREFRTWAGKSVNEIAKDYTIKESEIESGCAGDELRTFIVPEDQGDEAILRALRAALDLAFRVKINWLFSSPNMSRIRQDKAPTDIGVGIHVGPVAVDFPYRKGEGLGCEGFSITLCKRIESASRNGVDCQILLSQNTQQLIPDAYEFGLQTKEIEKSDMKGIPNPPKLYEVSGFNFIQNSIPYEYLEKLVGKCDKPLEEYSERAMQICRQSLWYGLLTLALLQAKKPLCRNKADLERLTTRQVNIAEGLVRRLDNLSLLQFLGFIYDNQLRMPERSIMFNKRALKINPDDIMSQFNLAVAMDHTKDSLEALEGQSVGLLQGIVGEYTKTKQLLATHGITKDLVSAKTALFKAGALRKLVAESIWERTGSKRLQEVTLSQREEFWIKDCAKHYLETAVRLRELKMKPQVRIWMKECLRDYARALVILSNCAGAESYYREARIIARKYLCRYDDEDVRPSIRLFAQNVHGGDTRVAS